MNKECKYRPYSEAAMRRKKEAERQRQRYLSLAAGNENTRKIHTDKICQRSAPVWLMSVLQIRRTIPYNARKAVAEIRKIEAGKGDKA